jgi:hypothetical protein
MIADPNIQLQFARDRADLLRADYGRLDLGGARLRRRLGLALVSVGLRVAGWPRTASEALPHSTRA